MAWNVFKIDSSKIGFYQNFLIYCDKFDNKIIYCLSRFRAGNFSLAPTSTYDITQTMIRACWICSKNGTWKSSEIRFDGICHRKNGKLENVRNFL